MNFECPVKELQIIETDDPCFEIVHSLPSGMAPQIQNAVRDFMVSSNLPQGIDTAGFYYQTLQSIANSVIVGQGRELWLGVKNGELYTYILANIGPDFDGRLGYMVNQAWVRADQRGKPWVREAWKKVRQRAKDTLCSHFIVLSSKGRTEAYCRFLGRGFHKVTETLKEEL